jgi:hypothetical protein
VPSPMMTSSVHALIRAVRQRLWRDRVVACARVAAWAATGWLVLAMGVHMATGAIPVAVLIAVAVTLSTTVILSGIAWRPADAACALWADRHLGGASAFSTLLDSRGDINAPAPRAMQALEQWASTKATESTRLLAGRRQPARLARPLLSLVMCAAVASIVMTSPEFASPSRQPIAAVTTSGIGQQPLADGGPLAAAHRMQAAADALRNAAAVHSHDAAKAAAQSPPDASAKPGHTLAQLAKPLAGAIRADRISVHEIDSPTAVDAVPMSVGNVGRPSGAGNAAGDGRDDSVATGARSIAPGVTQQTPASRRIESLRSEGRQANMDEAGIFADEASTPRSAALPANFSPAAAIPPPADPTRQTPTRDAYAQAWLNEIGRRR